MYNYTIISIYYKLDYSLGKELRFIYNALCNVL